VVGQFGVALVVSHVCRQVGKLGGMAHVTDSNLIACALGLTVTPSFRGSRYLD
jgi:hypothetical protein